MEAGKVLEIVRREIEAIGQGWRNDWSFFDGRTLRAQLESISNFADKALKSNIDIDYTEGTEFLNKNSDF